MSTVEPEAVDDVAIDLNVVVGVVEGAALAAMLAPGNVVVVQATGVIMMSVEISRQVDRNG